MGGLPEDERKPADALSEGPLYAGTAFVLVATGLGAWQAHRAAWAREREDRRAAKEAGMDDFMPKPVTLARLAVVVRGCSRVGGDAEGE